MPEVIPRLQGKREFNEIKGHIFRLLFIPDSCEVPMYGQLSKNFVEFQNTAHLALCLHSSAKIDALLNLPCFFHKRAGLKMWSRNLTANQSWLRCLQAWMPLCDIIKCRFPELNVSRHTVRKKRLISLISEKFKDIHTDYCWKTLTE